MKTLKEKEQDRNLSKAELLLAKQLEQACVRMESEGCVIHGLTVQQHIYQHHSHDHHERQANTF